MAGQSSQANNSEEEMITGINVTPLVDVMLVLLVMFMITAPVLYQSAIKVDLPKALSGEKTERVTLRLTLLQSKELLVDKTKVELSKLPEITKQVLEKDETADAILAADSAVSHGEVMKVVDVLRNNGLKKIAIGVDSPEGGAKK